MSHRQHNAADISLCDRFISKGRHGTVAEQPNAVGQVTSPFFPIHAASPTKPGPTPPSIYCSDTAAAKAPSLCGCFPGGCTQHRQKLFCSNRQFKPAFFSVLLTALDSIPRAFHFLFESHIKTGEAPLAGSFLFHAFDYVFCFFANARFVPSLSFYRPSAGMSSRIAMNAATETAAPIIN